MFKQKIVKVCELTQAHLLTSLEFLIINPSLYTLSYADRFTLVPFLGLFLVRGYILRLASILAFLVILLKKQLS